MVMYYLGMKYLVDPVIRWQERREKEQDLRLTQGLKRGVSQDFALGFEQGFVQGLKEGYAISQQQTHRKWLDWYQRSVDATARGEPFDEPPPA